MTVFLALWFICFVLMELHNLQYLLERKNVDLVANRFGRIPFPVLVNAIPQENLSSVTKPGYRS